MARRPDLHGVDAVVVPGGFSYGDYLRVGAIARFSPVMERGRSRSPREGGPVLGICNGFQVLCEAGLLPGALLPNTSLRFVCRQVDVEVVEHATRRSPRACAAGERLSIPVKHTTGRYFAPTSSSRAERGQVVLRYAAGPEPQRLAATTSPGVGNAEGNVVGLMPHPEHAVDAADRLGRRPRALRVASARTVPPSAETLPSAADAPARSA